MTRRPLALSIARRVKKDILAATEWWEANRRAAPGAITDEVDKALDLLQTAPEAGVSVPGTRLFGVRRVPLERIDYHLYYRINARRSRITVLALWHARRRPPTL